jgi:hypothetical protein
VSCNKHSGGCACSCGGGFSLCNCSGIPATLHATSFVGNVADPAAPCNPTTADYRSYALTHSTTPVTLPSPLGGTFVSTSNWIGPILDTSLDVNCACCVFQAGINCSCDVQYLLACSPSNSRFYLFSRIGGGAWQLPLAPNPQVCSPFSYTDFANTVTT